MSDGSEFQSAGAATLKADPAANPGASYRSAAASASKPSCQSNFDRPRGRACVRGGMIHLLSLWVGHCQINRMLNRGN